MNGHPNTDRSAEFYSIPVGSSDAEEIASFQAEVGEPQTYAFVLSPGGGISIQVPSLPVSAVNPVIQRMFNERRDRWLAETSFASDPVEIFMHPDHIKIIGMGSEIFPLVLREVVKRSANWFHVLDAINPYFENPIKPEDTDSFEKTANAWLAFGKAKGLI